MNAISEEENVIKITRKLRRTITALSELQINESKTLFEKTTGLIDEADILLEELYADFAKQQRSLDAIKILVNRVKKEGEKRCEMKAKDTHTPRVKNNKECLKIKEQILTNGGRA